MASRDRRRHEEATGCELRNLVLRCYIAHNPDHDRPGWEELRDHSRYTWTRVARALVLAGWLPPSATPHPLALLVRQMRAAQRVSLAEQARLEYEVDQAVAVLLGPAPGCVLGGGAS